MDSPIGVAEYVGYLGIINTFVFIGQLLDPVNVRDATELYYVNPTDYSHQLINPPDAQLLDPEKKTCFVIHGYTESHTDGLIVPVLNALVDSGYNVIAVDYSEISMRPYPELIAYAPEMAEVISDYIINNNMDTSKITIVGFSLGAHIAGYTGKNVQSQGYYIHKIMGIEPAGPLFGTLALIPCANRLCENDADIVITLQTNGGVLGTAFPIGQVHFVANGGRVQPGCSTDICSHQKAMILLADSFKRKLIGIRRDDGQKLIFNMDIPVNSIGIYDLKTK